MTWHGGGRVWCPGENISGYWRWQRSGSWNYQVLIVIDYHNRICKKNSFSEINCFRRLLHGGGHVIIGCRDSKYFGHQADKSKLDLCEVLHCIPENISIIHLDLSQMNSVKTFCDMVCSQHQYIGKIFGTSNIEG